MGEINISFRFKDIIRFYHIDLDKFSEGSPIDGFFSSKALELSPSKLEILLKVLTTMSFTSGMFTVLMP